MGNKEVKEKVLRYAIRGEGNLIIYGQKGLGQKALVREAVHAYTCKGDHSQNCDCLACQNTIERNPDVLWISAKKTALSVEEVSAVEEFTECGPAISRIKVIVLEGIENASEQAENTILKSMEDGIGVRYICIAYTNKVRPTIASRCTPYTLSPLSMGEFLSEMESTPWKDSEKRFWYCASSGCPEAVDRINAEGKTNLYRSVYDAYCAKDLKALLDALGLFREKDRNSVYQKNRKEIYGILSMLQTAAYAGVTQDIKLKYSIDTLMEQIKILGKEKEECAKPGYTQGQLLNAMLLLVK